MPSLAHTVSPGFALPQAGAHVSRLTHALRIWYIERQTRIALSRLSDRQLDDLGLARGDIDAAARKVARQ